MHLKQNAGTRTFFFLHIFVVLADGHNLLNYNFYQRRIVGNADSRTTRSSCVWTTTKTYEFSGPCRFLIKNKFFRRHSQLHAIFRSVACILQITLPLPEQWDIIELPCPLSLTHIEKQTHKQRHTTRQCIICSRTLRVMAYFRYFSFRRSSLPRIKRSSYVLRVVIQTTNCLA